MFNVQGFGGFVRHSRGKRESRFVGVGVDVILDFPTMRVIPNRRDFLRLGRSVDDLNYLNGLNDWNTCS